MNADNISEKVTVGILLFNEVEVLDFAGPFEVFSLATRNHQKCCNVVVIGETGDTITARNGLKIIPDKKITDPLHLDILTIPGGYGAEHIEIKNKYVLEWIKAQEKEVDILASVCTGAFLLAECGILDSKKATTHWMDIDKLEVEYPNIEVKRNVKFVDQGNIITSGGISAGIDMSFHLLERLFGIEVAKATAHRMEYDRYESV